jgi:probable F420-dependent oxidoreductase
VGVSSHEAGLLPAAVTREAAVEIERLGYRTLWCPEGRGFKDVFASAALVLAWTSRLTVASGIAVIWTRDAQATYSAANTLGEAFPGRFVLGLGVGHGPEVTARGHAYARPLSAMRSYLEALDQAAYVAAAPSQPVPRVLGAVAPGMLKLAGERASGAFSNVVPVEHTAFARRQLGDDAILAVLQPVLVSTDPAAARRIAREYLASFFNLDNYRKNLLARGWSEQDMADGGSDRIVDAIVAWGDPDTIRGRVQAHLDAGADHVCIRPLPSRAPAFHLGQLRELAPGLLRGVT